MNQFSILIALFPMGDSTAVESKDVFFSNWIDVKKSKQIRNTKNSNSQIIEQSYWIKWKKKYLKKHIASRWRINLSSYEHISWGGKYQFNVIHECSFQLINKVFTRQQAKTYRSNDLLRNEQPKSKFVFRFETIWVLFLFSVWHCHCRD